MFDDFIRAAVTSDDVNTMSYRQSVLTPFGTYMAIFAPRPVAQISAWKGNRKFNIYSMRGDFARVVGSNAAPL